MLAGHNPSFGLQQQPQDLQGKLLDPNGRDSRKTELSAYQVDFELIKAGATRKRARGSQVMSSLSGGDCTSILSRPRLPIVAALSVTLVEYEHLNYASRPLVHHLFTSSAW